MKFEKVIREILGILMVVIMYLMGPSSHKKLLNKILKSANFEELEEVVGRSLFPF